MTEQPHDLKGMSKFGNYNIPELLRAIANDYENQKAADSVRRARCMWLNDLADFLTQQEGKCATG